jgi:hypothetical protein
MTGYEIVTGGSATLSPQGTATLTASCPAGKVATGGGYTSMNEAANVHDSAPTANGNGWTISAKNENLVGSSFTVAPVAVCVDRPQGYEVLTGQVTMGHQESKTAEARCHDATFRLTGGGVATGDPVVHPFTSTPGTGAQPSWVAAFKSNYSILLPSSSSGKAFAICALLQQVPGQVVVSSAPVTLGLLSNSTLTVSCPSGTRALSGGVSSAESPAIWFDFAPAPGGGGWTASLRNPQSALDPVTVHATLVATCATAAP